MTDAAILATFSDFALVRSRKVARLIFEVPIEQAKTALDTLGMPDPAGETWCGIARVTKPGPQPSLTTGPAKEGGGGQGSATRTPPPSKLKRKWNELPRRDQAVLRCQDADFKQFIQERARYHQIPDEDFCAQYVRNWCEVDSRSEIDASNLASLAWARLEEDFKAWRSERRQ